MPSSLLSVLCTSSLPPTVPTTRAAPTSSGTPLLFIFRTMATHYLKVQLLHSTTDGPGLPITNQTMIHTYHRRNLRTGSTHKNLIGNIEFSTIDLSLTGDTAKLMCCQLHH